MKNIKIFIILFFTTITLDPSFANSKIVNSVGLGIGTCLPQGGWDPGYTISAQADFGEAIKYIYVSPYLSFSSASKTEDINNISEQMSIQYINFGAKFLGYLNSKPRGIYIGGAISYNVISYDMIEWADFSENNEIKNTTTNKLGFAGLAGYSFMLKNLSVFIELNYMFTVGGFNNVSALAGVNLNL
jgi:hypothetical protein